jgi:hypothetical protein
MRIFLWVMIVVFGALALLNLPGLHSVQDWVFGNWFGPIQILETIVVIIMFFVIAWGFDDYRRKQPWLWAIIAIAGACYISYATLIPGPREHPEMPDLPTERQVTAAVAALMFAVSGIIGQARPPKPK